MILYIMKKIILFSLVFTCRYANAQTANDVTEAQPYIEDGLEMGYNIVNSSTKETNSTDYSRYEVSFYVTNKSGAAKFILYSLSFLGSDDETSMKQVAKFDCVNATGARLTSKGAMIELKPFYVTAKQTKTNCDGKTVTEKNKVQIGYFIAAGATLHEKVILLVPLNEQPQIKVRLLQQFTIL